MQRVKVTCITYHGRKPIIFYEKYGFSFDGGKKEEILITPITELRMVMNF